MEYHHSTMKVTDIERTMAIYESESLWFYCMIHLTLYLSQSHCNEHQSSSEATLVHKITTLPEPCNQDTQSEQDPPQQKCAELLALVLRYPEMLLLQPS